MSDKDSALIIEISQNVKYLRQSFDEHKEQFKDHVEKDEKNVDEYIKPLWEAHQQQRGFVKMGSLVWAFILGFISIVGAYLGVKIAK